MFVRPDIRFLVVVVLIVAVDIVSLVFAHLDMELAAVRSSMITK